MGHVEAFNGVPGVPRGGCSPQQGNNNKPLPPGATAETYCNLCEIQFDEKAGLEEHLKTHRPYSCEVCEKRFSQKCNLITHMRLHTGEKPYLCGFCDKRFTQKGNLDAHVKTHTKEKPYPCTQCGRKFAFKSSMLAHVKQAHGGTVMSGPGSGGNLSAFDWEEDDISSIKQQLKYNNPGDFVPAPSLTPPVTSPNPFSSGIPTPQSSLDSIPGSIPAPPISAGGGHIYHGQGYLSSALDTPRTPQSANSETDSVVRSHNICPPAPDMTNHISKLASLAAGTGGSMSSGSASPRDAPPPANSAPNQASIGVN